LILPGLRRFGGLAGHVPGVESSDMRCGGFLQDDEHHVVQRIFMKAPDGREALRERLALPGFERTGQFFDGFGREFLRSLGNSFRLLLFEGFLFFCPPWQRGLLPRRTNALSSGPRRPAVRAVKGAGSRVHRSAAQTLDQERTVWAQSFRGKGREEKR
jgi:hypothetical protein